MYKHRGKAGAKLVAKRQWNSDHAWGHKHNTPIYCGRNPRLFVWINTLPSYVEKSFQTYLFYRCLMAILVPKVVNQLVAAAPPLDRYAEVLLKSQNDTSEILGSNSQSQTRGFRRTRKLANWTEMCSAVPSPFNRPLRSQSNWWNKFMYVQIWTVLSYMCTVIVMLFHIYSTLVFYMYEIYTLDMTSSGQFQIKNIRKLDICV